MAEYRSVEGEVGAINTLTNLTTFGSETGVGPVKVPANASKLVEIWIAIALSTDTAQERQIVTLRLSGKGMASGDQDLIAGGIASGVTSTGTYGAPSTPYAVDMDVVPNETINIAVAAAGESDVLLGSVGVTLVFA